MTELPKLLSTERAVEYCGMSNARQFLKFAERHGLRPFDKDTRPYYWRRSDIDRTIEPEASQNDDLMNRIMSYAG